MIDLVGDFRHFNKKHEDYDTMKRRYNQYQRLGVSTTLHFSHVKPDTGMMIPI
jgi:hypothetical protein